jgi:hypothetical protein
MLEEKTDNLLEADGNLENNSIEIVQTETEISEKIETIELNDSNTAEEVQENVETLPEETVAETETVVEIENQA